MNHKLKKDEENKIKNRLKKAEKAGLFNNIKNINNT